MAQRPLILRRPALFERSALEQIEETAARILEQVGLAVLDETLRSQLASQGFHVRRDRVLIERKRFGEFLDAERKRHGDQFSQGPERIELPTSRIDVGVLTYPQHVHDIEADRVVPFTIQRLIEATKLLDMCSIPGPPGCPTDVAPALQPVVQNWIGAVYSRHTRSWVDPKALETLPYIAEMAEVMGYPIRSLPVYVFSPLTLGGESLRCVLASRERLSSISVSDMPSLGCSAPIYPGDAFAVAVAEVIGSVILLREVLEIPIHWSVRICPIDMRSMAMVLGSPEDFLLQLANAEINAYFHGTRWYPAAGAIHTSAKLPGAQACAEKASLMTAGALLGARRFYAVGTLSLDEVFSGEQLLYDLEIRDHVQRLVEGLDTTCDPERCLSDLQEAFAWKNFTGLERTARHHREVYWQPTLFDRQFLAAWQMEGSPTIRARTRARIRQLLAQHDYELAGEPRRQLDAILERAKKQLI